MQKHIPQPSVEKRRKTPRSTARKTETWASLALKYAWIPIPVFLLLIAVGWILSPDEGIRGPPPFLQGPLLFVFQGLIPGWAAILASRSFLRGGSVPILIFGAGMMVFAATNIFSSIAFHYGEEYTIFIVYTFGATAAAGAFLVGATAASIVGDWTIRRSAKLFLAGAYALAFLITGLLMVLVSQWIITPQLVEEIGFTTLRRLLVTPVAFLFALDAGVLLWLSRYRNWTFGKWFGLALALVATSELGLALTEEIGHFSADWAGRFAYYLGGIYLLIAMLQAHKGKEHWELLAYSALRESEERFRALAEASREGIAVCEATVIADANEQLARMLGYPVEELIGKSIADFVPAKRASQIMAGLLSDVDVATEHQMISRSGRKMIVESYGRTLPRPGYDIQVWVIRDITPRKHREQEVRESEQELRALFDNMSEGMGMGEPVFDADGRPCDIRFLKVNQAFEAHTGIQNVVGRPLREVLPQLEPVWVERQSRVALTGEPQRFEQYNEDTGRYYRCVVYSPLEGKFAILFSDITEEKRVEELSRQATETNARYLAKTRAILEQMTEGLVIFDPSGTVLEANHAAMQMHGFKDFEDVNTHVTDLPSQFQLFEVYGLDGQRLPLKDWPVSRSLRESFVSYKVRIRRSDTGKEWVASTGGGPVYDEEGNILVATLTMRDVTEEYEAQQALRRSHDELEERVRERTAELQQRADQLARLTSELTLTEQRERRRLAQVLHDDLQQLLVGAKFGLHFLRKRVASEHEKSVEDVDRLLNEAIATSRSLTIDLSPPILHEAGLSAGVEWLARWMKSKYDLHVDLDLDPNVIVEREAVRLLVFQAIRELLFNVSKHAGVDRAEVKLRQQNGELCAEVEDHGSGFDVDKVLNRRSDLGTGFGLFSIRERLDLLGGRLEVESKPGKGCHFTLFAPLLTEDKAPQLPEDGDGGETEEGVRVEQIKGAEQKIRLLLVDDHAVVRQGLSVLLRSQEDVEVVGEASDGKMAVCRARQLRPDVVLMDFSMPQMDGVEATRLIRDELPDVRVIGLSMYEEVDRAQAMVDAGASAYLCKSGKADELLETIRRVAANPPNLANN